MVADRQLRVTQGRQAVGAVPFLEEGGIGQQPFLHIGRQIKAKRLHALRELLFAGHALFFSLSPAFGPVFGPTRFKCTSSSEIAAGVMPWMREAWPSVCGWCCFSFCCT